MLLNNNPLTSWDWLAHVERLIIIMRKINFNNLILLVVLTLLACSKSDDESNIVPPNGKGVTILANGQVDDCYFWINNEYVKLVSTNDTEDLSKIDFSVTTVPYYPLTMDIVYQMVYEEYHCEKSWIDEQRKKGQDYPGSLEIKFCERNLSKYKYITKVGPDFFFFNRTSNVNY